MFLTPWVIFTQFSSDKLHIKGRNVNAYWKQESNDSDYLKHSNPRNSWKLLTLLHENVKHLIFVVLLRFFYLENCKASFERRAV